MINLSLEAMTANVQSLQSALAVANADVVLLTRLKSAETDAARITVELATAEQTLAIAMADAVTTKRAQTYANIKGISIAVTLDPTRVNSALAASYTISVEQIVYDMNTRQSVPSIRTYEGFRLMPSDAYGYLMEVKPETIPAIIMALAPGDYLAAMNAYWLGMRRGHLG